MNRGHIGWAWAPAQGLVSWEERKFAPKDGQRGGHCRRSLRLQRRGWEPKKPGVAGGQRRPATRHSTAARGDCRTGQPGGHLDCGLRPPDPERIHFRHSGHAAHGQFRQGPQEPHTEGQAVSPVVGQTVLQATGGAAGGGALGGRWGALAPGARNPVSTAADEWPHTEAPRCPGVSMFPPQSEGVRLQRKPLAFQSLPFNRSCRVLCTRAPAEPHGAQFPAWTTRVLPRPSAPSELFGQQLSHRWRPCHPPQDERTQSTPRGTPTCGDVCHSSPRGQLLNPLAPRGARDSTAPGEHSGQSPFSVRQLAGDAAGSPVCEGPPRRTSLPQPGSAPRKEQQACARPTATRRVHSSPPLPGPQHP